MNFITQFVTDIRNVAKTRKFWVALLSVLGQSLAVQFGDTQTGAVVIGLLGALGVYTVKNQ